ncbi:G2/M phase-specific E3 ubiquitin-protein ligase-like isoform X1 [Boleophthalmus pectinirostris]|uniref:G2/M phase-specific E3 ubiquitin-protein ligase-like isoform X1 n=2 Tax=Boleophthalmus pectinirostris TaxID=150288 RepID=UPI00243056F2|nr:G2/M phase-specific E3 ubiquitin-protein ligase-like isoform X1 [Boleophthalmus pectinirostris]XP_055015661.1 G2/M phase-specific E3 ubiquitin-protein ligase-like isoform X1 [Boleophthalmus pectinirostris]XP_055021326.1 G2/M phase-specific E3 ubiquitin-protein ligase-like isoform X1 [Boleophthalmus pectinirostris]
MLHNLPPVKIYVGVMRLTGDSLKPVRGKSLPLDIQPHWSSEQLLAAAVKKHMDFNQDMQDVVHVLLYPDGRQVRNIPGTNDPFTVQKYKEAIGKAYQRITLYICTAEDFETSCYTGQSSSEDDSVVHVNLPSVESELSDTVVWDTPDNVSTPKTDNILQGPSRCQQPESHQDGQQSTPQDQLRSSQNLNTWYSNYTTMYAPIVVDSESETDDHIDYPAEHPQVLNLTAEDIVSDLASKITNTSYSRFNINRANIWDGAIRGFKRPSYDPSHEILVKFTDDEGRAEDAVDTGGPKREFLTLLMDCLRSRRIFDGPDDRKFLTFDCAAARDDEYFHVGRMIATSIVHGGPGPRFLSEMLYDHLTGKSTADFEARIEDITDDTMRASLLEISSAATLVELHAVIDKHSSLLQMAGCLQYPKVVLDKKIIMKDFMQWYFIYRNHFSIQRFKDGLSTLNMIHALEQHASIFKTFMCSSVEQLTSTILENLFEVQLSEQGTTRRQEETKVLAFWRDYLLDTEDKQTGLSLPDILMFATGLCSLPPSGIKPRPKLVFQRVSRFPCSRTCANTMEIPLSTTYEEFQKDMDFGIQNSPGFGLY